MRLAVSVMAAVIVLVHATVAASLPAQQSTDTATRYFMRNDGTSCPGTPFLSPTAGTNESVCGFPLGAPGGELDALAGGVRGEGTVDYTTRVDPSIFLDSGAPIRANIQIAADTMTNGAGVGEVRVDLTVLAKTQDGGDVALAQATQNQSVSPFDASPVDFAFHVAVPDTLDDSRLESLAAVVTIRGWHALTGYRRLDGQSWVEIPHNPVEGTAGVELLLGPVGSTDVPQQFSERISDHAVEHIDFDDDGLVSFQRIPEDRYSEMGVRLTGLEARDVSPEPWTHSPPFGAQASDYNTPDFTGSYRLEFNEPVQGVGWFANDVEAPMVITVTTVTQETRAFTVPSAGSASVTRFYGLVANDYIRNVSVQSNDLHILDDVMFGRPRES